MEHAGRSGWQRGWRFARPEARSGRHAARRWRVVERLRALDGRRAFRRDFHVRVLEHYVAGTSIADNEASLLIIRNFVGAGRRFTWAEPAPRSGDMAVVSCV